MQWFAIGHVDVQSCLLIIFQYQPIRLRLSVEQPIRVWLNVKHHWKFTVHKKITPKLTCPILSIHVLVFRLEDCVFQSFKTRNGSNLVEISLKRLFGLKNIIDIKLGILTENQWPAMITAIMHEEWEVNTIKWYSKCGIKWVSSIAANPFMMCWYIALICVFGSCSNRRVCLSTPIDVHKGKLSSY